MKDYLKLLNELKQGTIDNLEIEASEFQSFQAVFMDFPERKQVIGIADREGKITYHFEKNENDQ